MAEDWNIELGRGWFKIQSECAAHAIFLFLFLPTPEQNQTKCLLTICYTKEQQEKLQSKLFCMV